MNAKNTVIIDITGMMAERFINAANREGAVFYDVTRKKDGLSAVIEVRHIKLLRKAARQSGCKVKFRGRRGPKFVAAALKKRFVLPVGLLLAASLIWYAGQFVWLIGVDGNSKIPETEIIGILEEYGVHPGIRRDSALFRQVEQEILIERDEFSYIALKIKGISMTVKVVEAKEPPVIYDPSARGDIIAACDAVVESINVFAGTAMVKPGETVKAGQILISGYQNGERVCALGDVTGSIWYQGTGKSGLFTEIYEKTGRESIGRHLKTPWIYVIITEEEEFSQSLAETKEIGLLDGLFLGISLVTERHFETRTIIEPVSYNIAKENALRNAYENLLKALPLGVVPSDTSVTYGVSTGDASATAKVQVRTVKNIGEPHFYE